MTVTHCYNIPCVGHMHAWCQLEKLGGHQKECLKYDESTPER